LKTALSLFAIFLPGLAGFGVVSPADAASPTCHASSPDFRAAVIELYTSEGCSSCPPADDWLRRLPRKDLASGRVVPLAFHVDYWNYLGWADPFSQPRFASRQRSLAAHNRTLTIYTPGVFLNSQEWRGWHRNELSTRLEMLARLRPAANIELNAALRNDTILVNGEVVWRAAPPDGALLQLAVLENQLVSTVRAGENAGRTLYHDHVVRYLSSGMALSHGVTTFETRIALPGNWKRANLSFVALVQDGDNGPVLQALRLPWCGR